MQTAAASVAAEMIAAVKAGDADALRTILQRDPAALGARTDGGDSPLLIALYHGRRDLVGKPIRQALPESAGQGFFELLDRVYRTGEAYTGSGVRVLVVHQPGRPPEERYLDFVYQPTRDPDGAVTGVLAQGVDLTDRRRAEEALAHRRASRTQPDALTPRSATTSSPSARSCPPYGGNPTWTARARRRCCAA